MTIADHMAEALVADPHLKQRMQADPVGTLETMAAMPLQTDVWIYRGVVGSLGIVVILTVLGSILLSFYGKPMSEGLIAIGSAAVGALAGLLAPSPRG